MAAQPTCIYLLAEETLQTDLLCFALKKEIGASCQRFDSMENLPVGQNGSSAKTLVLVDVLRQDMGDFLMTLRAKKGAYTAMYLTAIYNADADTGVEQRALQQGIRGFFYINSSFDLLLKGIKAMMNGEIWISREVLVQCVLNVDNQVENASNNGGDLTSRQTEILLLVCLGKRNDEIADKLFISKHTVKTHLYNIFKKLHVPNRLQAALWASHHL